MKPLKTIHFCLILVLAGWLTFNIHTPADGFTTFKQLFGKDYNILIRKIHEDHWTIGYEYRECPPKKMNNNKALEAAMTQVLQAWLQPVRDLNTGKPVVNDFRYEPNLKAENEDDLKKYDLLVVFFCDFGKSNIAMLKLLPPIIDMHAGTEVTLGFMYVLLHETGHAFGLYDTYIRPELGIEMFGVSRGGVARTIGHQPSSIMSGFELDLVVGPLRLTEDDKNGIIWLYKFYHENLALEDCLFPDYEWETSPDGCRPKYPLIFEIKHGIERYAVDVLNDDETINVNARDTEGSTALFWAAKLGYYGVAERLVNHPSIDVDLRAANGTTPLKEAATQGHTRIVDLLLEHEPREDDWTAVDATAPASHRSVFYLHVPLPDERLVFHVGYLGTVLGGDALFVAQKREDDSIENYLDQDDVSLIGYQGLVAENIKVREVASFPSADGETESLLLSIRDVDFSDYEPLQFASVPPLTEMDVELLTYKLGSGVLLDGVSEDEALALPLRMRECVSVPHGGLEAVNLYQHTCGPANSVSEGSLLFDKEKGRLIGFYRTQDRLEILGDGLSLADVVSEGLIRLVDRKPVTPKNRLTTVWAEIKRME